MIEFASISKSSFMFVLAVAKRYPHGVFRQNALRPFGPFNKNNIVRVGDGLAESDRGELFCFAYAVCVHVEHVREGPGGRYGPRSRCRRMIINVGICARFVRPRPFKNPCTKVVFPGAKFAPKRKDQGVCPFFPAASGHEPPRDRFTDRPSLFRR